MKRSKWDSSDEETTSNVNVVHITKKKSLEESNVTSIQSDHQENELISNLPLHREVIDTDETIEEDKLDHNPLTDGCRSIDEYQRLNFISEGTYGAVFRARCKKTQRIYAVKQIKLGQDFHQTGFPLTALREANILLMLKHPNIIRVREMVVGSSMEKIFMVMDYCDNDLKYCLDQCEQPFSAGEVKQLMLQLLSAIAFMHEHWYIHRDLKTSNLLYSNNGILKVCDFGMARRFGNPIAKYTQEVVTLWYRPPELLLGASTYSTALDCWSVGCIFGEILSNKPMFPGQGEIDQINKIIRSIGHFNEDRWPGCSQLPNFSKISNKIVQ